MHLYNQTSIGLSTDTEIKDYNHDTRIVSAAWDDHRTAWKQIRDALENPPNVQRRGPVTTLEDAIAARRFAAFMDGLEKIAISDSAPLSALEFEVLTTRPSRTLNETADLLKYQWERCDGDKEHARRRAALAKASAAFEQEIRPVIEAPEFITTLKRHVTRHHAPPEASQNRPSR